jgi:very-short-patch-repair endonuclease
MAVAVRTTLRKKRIVQARSLRREMTTPERKLWRHLRDIQSGESHFRRQAPIGPYFADFACHKTRVVIEIDGETHTADTEITHDEARSRYFRSYGYRVLRFWNSDVMKNIEGVMALIGQSLAEQPPPLTPPHASRGRGTS